MSEASEHLELLKNAVRQPIAALTAVETDTVYQAKELAKMLAAEIGERPNEMLSMAVEAGAAALLYQARRISENWTDEQGVLFVIDDGGKDAEKRYPFWVEMNGLRESWAALNCHVIFFLLPHNYRMLLQVADHLADWISLKLHMFEIEDSSSETSFSEDGFLFETELFPNVAHQQLATLEKQLTQALQKEIEPQKLIRLYYLPMLQASIELADMHRALSLKEKISEEVVPKSDLPKWWFMNYYLYNRLRDFDRAKECLEKLYEWSKISKNLKEESKALFGLGRLASTQYAYENAKEFYRKSLEIKEKCGDEYGIARIYNQIGRVSYAQKKFEESDDWYQKALKIEEKLANEYGMAIIYRDLGINAQEQREFESAESCYKRSLKLYEKVGNIHGVAANYYQLGTIAQEQINFESAENWYKKALAIFEKQGYEHWAARTYRNLGILARQQDRLESSGEWLIKSIKAFENTNDPENAGKAKEEFRTTHAQASPDVQAKLKEMWEAAGLSEP